MEGVPPATEPPGERGVPDGQTINAGRAAFEGRLRPALHVYAPLPVIERDKSPMSTTIYLTPEMLQ